MFYPRPRHFCVSSKSAEVCKPSCGERPTMMNQAKVKYLVAHSYELTLVFSKTVTTIPHGSAGCFNFMILACNMQEGSAIAQCIIETCELFLLPFHDVLLSMRMYVRASGSQVWSQLLLVALYVWELSLHIHWRSTLQGTNLHSSALTSLYLGHTYCFTMQWMDQVVFLLRNKGILTTQLCIRSTLWRMHTHIPVLVTVLGSICKNVHMKTIKEIDNF